MSEQLDSAVRGFRLSGIPRMLGRMENSQILNRLPQPTRTRPALMSIIFGLCRQSRDQLRWRRLCPQSRSVGILARVSSPSAICPGALGQRCTRDENAGHWNDHSEPRPPWLEQRVSTAQRLLRSSVTFLPAAYRRKSSSSSVWAYQPAAFALRRCRRN